ncbi:hypothetical protein ACFSQW_21015 [Sphingobacterium tabacisoli]|uniref:Uncharacterized protein n=1 Tax=Sphingobacterium tabacisoli TaxID=2044855 RepID=A0ABW5L7Z7_9SPHI
MDRTIATILCNSEQAFLHRDHRNIFITYGNGNKMLLLDSVWERWTEHEKLVK